MDKATLTPEVEAALRLRPAPRRNKYADPVVPMEGSIFPPMEDAAPAQPDGVLLRNGSDLKPEPITWLWQGSSQKTEFKAR